MGSKWARGFQFQLKHVALCHTREFVSIVAWSKWVYCINHRITLCDTNTWLKYMRKKKKKKKKKKRKISNKLSVSTIIFFLWPFLILEFFNNHFQQSFSSLSPWPNPNPNPKFHRMQGSSFLHLFLIFFVIFLVVTVTGQSSKRPARRQTVSSSESSSERDSDDDNSQKMQFKCPNCAQRFQRSSNYTQHMKYYCKGDNF